MGMQIYVQKLSNPVEEWSIDVESSDTIEGVKSKIVALEPSHNIQSIKLFYPAVYSTDLDNEQTLSFYNIQKNTHLNCYSDLYVSGTFFDQATDPDENVSVYAKGLYKVWPVLFNNIPQWYLDGDDTKSRLFYAGAPTISWILTVETPGGSNSIFCPDEVIVSSPIQLTSSDWDSSILLNGISSTDIIISYEDLSDGYYCNPIYDKFAAGSEDGCKRFRRLVALGYV